MRASKLLRVKTRRSIRNALLGSVFAIAWGHEAMAWQARGDTATRPAEAGREATLYRDDFGVPHIVAGASAPAFYALGWAQAEDRLEQILLNYMFALGRSAEVMGPGLLAEDVRTLTWEIRADSRAALARLDPQVRAELDAFAAGVTAYLSSNPQRRPAWWEGNVTADMLAALIARLTLVLQYWQAFDAAEHNGVHAEAGPGSRGQAGSNAVAVRAARSGLPAALLISDPHLPWFGPVQFSEFRLHIAQVNVSGFAFVGLPYAIVGHNDHVAWGTTVGGPDVADVIALPLAKNDRGKYCDPAGCREFKTREHLVRIAGTSEPTRITLRSTKRGPVLALTPVAALVGLSPYRNDVRSFETLHRWMRARNTREFAAALASGGLFPMNLMVADSEGNIYFEQTGVVPRRDRRIDWSVPVDGMRPGVRWGGRHPHSDLVSIANPPAGYLVSTNNLAIYANRDGFDTSRYPSYILDGFGAGQNDRGEILLDWFDRHPQFSLDDALKLASDTWCLMCVHWIEYQRRSENQGMPTNVPGLEVRKAWDILLQWDGRLDANSQAALLYVYWQDRLRERVGDDRFRELQARASISSEAEKKDSPARLNGDVDDVILALKDAAQDLARGQETGVHKYGDLFRIGRGPLSLPVSGGAVREVRISSLRAVTFTAEGSPGHRVFKASGGPAGSQVVLLSQPVRSFTVVPYGQSDDEHSPHYADQMQDLFSRGTWKPSWFELRELLDGHVRSKRSFTYSSKPGVAHHSGEHDDRPMHRSAKLVRGAVDDQPE